MRKLRTVSFIVLALAVSIALMACGGNKQPAFSASASWLVTAGQMAPLPLRNWVKESFDVGTGFGRDYGTATAVAVMLLVLVLALIIAEMKLADRADDWG
jgi:hypothetical protein